jgi:hypothetical protein
MPWTSKHIKWLKTVGTLTTTDGHSVKVLELVHHRDDNVLSEWAKHFRNHYCLDTELDVLRKGTKHSRASYLREIKFPDKAAAPGPSIRAGDFAEILIADYLEYVLGYWVPRTRYGDKTIRNESTKGCDIIGFRFVNESKDSPKDVLAIFEAKAQFSGEKPKARLQDAVEGSAKDQLRKAESLNAMKQRLLRDNKADGVKKVERFQDIEDRPYTELFGAAALFCLSVYDEATVAKTKTGSHPHSDSLVLIVVRGKDMMALVHELYERAANEA